MQIKNKICISEFAKREKYQKLLPEILGKKKKKLRNWLKNYFSRHFLKEGTLYLAINTDKIKDNVVLVAHYDTVHNDKKNRKVYWDKEENVLWSPDGLGADDRAGIWSLIIIWDYFMEFYPDKLPVLIFTDLEERGGQGAWDVATNSEIEFSEASYLIELDRKGSKDAVFYNDEPDNFKEYICDFGFIENWGSYSDIQTIGEIFNICSVNLSVGYYEQHTKYEYLKLNENIATLIKVVNMIKVNAETPIHWKLSKILSWRNSYEFDINNTEERKYYYKSDSKKVVCPFCYSQDNVLTYDECGKIQHYCENCYMKFDE